MRLVFLKIIFLKTNKILLLIDVYKCVEIIPRKWRRIKRPPIRKIPADISDLEAKFKGWTEREVFVYKLLTNNVDLDPGSKYDPKLINNFLKKTLLNPFILHDLAYTKGVILNFILYQTLVKKAPPSLKEVESFFTNNTLALNAFKDVALNLERFLFNNLLFPVKINLKNVFKNKNYKNLIFKRQKKLSYNLSNISKLVYVSCKKSRKFTFIVYTKDMVNIFNLALFFNKAGLISEFLTDVIFRKNRKFLKDIRSVGRLLPFFNYYYFHGVKSSIKIYVLGKMKSMKARRFRRVILKQGGRFSTQNTKSELSYSSNQTWNVFGSFGVKVWLLRDYNCEK